MKHRKNAALCRKSLIFKRVIYPGFAKSFNVEAVKHNKCSEF